MIASEDVRCMELAQYLIQQQALILAVLNPRSFLPHMALVSGHQTSARITYNLFTKRASDEEINTSTYSREMQL
jgi:hypothetical protein